MSEKYKILSNFVKDMSSETPDVESYLSTKNNINKYELDIDISSKPLKNKLIEVNTSLKFQNKSQADKKSYFEIVYASIVKIEESVKEKKDLQKIILCDIQNDIYNLFCSDGNKPKFYQIAYIPDYKTSVMMNSLFRNISENLNLDTLEESEDE